MVNPFDNPTTISDPGRFIGRDEQLSRIFDLLKNYQNISLIGTRRIGKSSLLNCLKNRSVQTRLGLPEKVFVFFFVDLQEALLGKEDLHADDFLAILNLAIKRQWPAYLEEAQMTREFSDELLADLLQEVKSQQFHPVLILDSFDLITKYKQIDSMLFSFLRALGSRYVSYIIASTQTLRTLCPQDNEDLGSPFFNIFGTVQLGPFSEKESRELLTTYAVAGGLPFTRDEVNWAVKMAGFHPYVLQQVGSALFREKSIGDPEKVDLQKAKKEAYQNLEEYFDDYWRRLSKDEQNYLFLKMRNKSPQEDKYSELLTSDLFCDYLQKVHALETTSRSFEEFLTKLDDTSALGKSAFAQHPIILARIRAEGLHESDDQGTIVRKILQDAFEQMRASGTRRDTEPEWQAYNILYYCYFGGSNLTHRQIATRLGISERHYYRERARALEGLKNLLLKEMPMNGNTESSRHTS